MKLNLDFAPNFRTGFSAYHQDNKRARGQSDAFEPFPDIAVEVADLPFHVCMMHRRLELSEGFHLEYRLVCKTRPAFQRSQTPNWPELGQAPRSTFSCKKFVSL